MNRSLCMALLLLSALCGCSKATVAPTSGPELITCEAFQSRVAKGEIKSLAVLHSQTVLLTLQSGKELRLQAGCGFDVVAYVQKHAPNQVLIALE